MGSVYMMRETAATPLWPLENHHDVEAAPSHYDSALNRSNNHHHENLRARCNNKPL
jgi:hypothetical protein